VKLLLAVLGVTAESVTRTVNWLFQPPKYAGEVPVRMPSGLNMNPGATLPVATSQLSGTVPPCAVKVRLYGTPATPPGRGEGVVMVMTGGGGGGEGGGGEGGGGELEGPPPPQPERIVVRTIMARHTSRLFTADHPHIVVTRIVLNRVRLAR
jgi:hypothetical protein